MIPIYYDQILKYQHDCNRSGYCISKKSKSMKNKTLPQGVQFDVQFGCFNCEEKYCIQHTLIDKSI